MTGTSNAASPVSGPVCAGASPNREKIAALAPGSKVAVSILRKGEQKTLMLALEPMPNDRQAKAGAFIFALEAVIDLTKRRHGAGNILGGDADAGIGQEIVGPATLVGHHVEQSVDAFVCASSAFCGSVSQACATSVAALHAAAALASRRRATAARTASRLSVMNARSSTSLMRLVMRRVA